MIPLNALYASHFLRIMYFRCYQLLILLPRDKKKKISITSDCVADGLFDYFNIGSALVSPTCILQTVEEALRLLLIVCEE